MVSSEEARWEFLKVLLFYFFILVIYFMFFMREMGSIKIETT